ncbi:hypothetical protein LINPERHAP1_LOCUS3164 [Linum perenne]
MERSDLGMTTPPCQDVATILHNGFPMFIPSHCSSDRGYLRIVAGNEEMVVYRMTTSHSSPLAQEYEVDGVRGDRL